MFVATEVCAQLNDGETAPGLLPGGCGGGISTHRLKREKRKEKKSETELNLPGGKCILIRSVEIFRSLLDIRPAFSCAALREYAVKLGGCYGYKTFFFFLFGKYIFIRTAPRPCGFSFRFASMAQPDFKRQPVSR